ncbi:MAG: amidohydrolase family protein [Gemmatimonadaceae bacterium]
MIARTMIARTMIARTLRVRLGAVATALTLAACRDVSPPHAPPPRFSIIDIHTHLGGVETWPGKRPNFDELRRTMSEMRVELVVDFKAPDHSLENGVFGDRVSQRIALYPDTARFKLFANIPIDDDKDVFVGSRRADYPTWVAGILEDAVRRGAVGLKIKDQAGAGYWTRDTSGTLVPFDAPAYDSLWSTAERLGIPVLVHLGGAYKGEHQAPNGPNKNVRWEMLMLQRERVLRKHPRLKLIGAHWAGTAGDRTYLEEILERYPNMYTEGGAHQPKAEFAQLDSAEQAFFERYQDQVMFGTDYMENTFRWLKSYRQRLDMFLPFTERWPLPDSVMAKYYHGNARRLLKRASASGTPVAHPGFTVTRVVGDTVALDGSASYALPGQTLRFQWRQIEGLRVRLVGDATAQPRFVATALGDLAFELVVSVGPLASRARSVRVNVIPPDGQFVEADGQVVIEAEHFTDTTPHGGQAWSVARGLAGFSGDGYVVASPKRGTVTEPGQFRTRAPELRYAVWIQQPGTYVVYARGAATDTASSSVHFGLDNEEARLADRVGRFPVGRWGWARDAFEWDAQFQMTDTTVAVLNVVQPGPHLLNVWMHRDGVMLDRVMLVRAPYAEVTKPLFDPGLGAGPPESLRRGPR